MHLWYVKSHLKSEDKSRQHAEKRWEFVPRAKAGAGGGVNFEFLAVENTTKMVATNQSAAAENQFGGF